MTVVATLFMIDATKLLQFFILSFSLTIKELEELKNKDVKTGDDFNRYLDLERDLKREKFVRKSLTSAVVTEMRSLFEEDEE